MSGTLAYLRKDLLRLARDPWGVLVWLAIPFVLAALMSAAFGGQGQPAALRPTVLLVDEDESVATGLLRALLAQRWADEAAELHWTSREEGEARVADGEATALLVLPAGLQSAWLEGRELELPLVLHPGQRILPGIVLEAAELAVELAEWTRRLLAEDLRRALEEGEGGLAALPVGLRMAEVGEIVQRWADPPRLSVRTEVPEREPGPSLVEAMLPGWLWMALVFMAQGLAADAWREREQGTLSRTLALPGGERRWLLGKLGAGALVATLVLGAGLLFAGRDASLGARLVAGLFGVLVFVGFHAGLLWIALRVGSARAASLVSSVIVFPLLMLGGSYFPLSALPDAIAEVGRLTPTGWTLGVFEDLLRDRAELGIALGTGLGAALVVGLLVAACARRLRGGFAAGAS